MFDCIVKLIEIKKEISKRYVGKIRRNRKKDKQKFKLDLSILDKKHSEYKISLKEIRVWNINVNVEI